MALPYRICGKMKSMIVLPRIHNSVNVSHSIVGSVSYEFSLGMLCAANSLHLTLQSGSSKIITEKRKK